MTLIIHNKSGASKEYPGIESKEEAREIIATWGDPESLKVTILDEGDLIWKSVKADEA